MGNAKRVKFLNGFKVPEVNNKYAHDSSKKFI